MFSCAQYSATFFMIYPRYAIEIVEIVLLFIPSQQN